MTIKTTALAVTTAILLTANSTSSEARINYKQEFCDTRYCGQYSNVYYKTYKAKKSVRYVQSGYKWKASKTLTHKEKTVKAAIPLPKPKSLTVVAYTEYDGVKFITPVPNLVALARKHLGTNPTGWRSLWCGRFMAMIAPHAAKKIPNPNLAINWTKLPKVAPKVGAILVTRRSGGSGHVGVVIAFDKRGNPITISGNHNRKVGIGTYPKYKIIAYVTA